MKERAKRLQMVRSEPTVIVGVDIAKHRHWAWSMDNQTELPVGKPFTFDNTRAGFGRLVTEIGKAKEQIGASRVVIGMEPSGHYWKPLATFLREAGFTVVIVNPYHVKQAKEFDDNSPSKSDRKDAWVIARRVNDADFFVWHDPVGVYAELRRLLYAREQVVHKKTMVTNQLHAILDEYFPEFEDVFSNVLGKAALHALKNFPFPTDVLRLREQRLADALRTASAGKVGLQRAQALQRAARGSIGVRHGLDATRMRLKQIAADVERWKRQLVDIETAMASALKQTVAGAHMMTVPGLGVVAVASILGETGDLEAYASWRQLRRLAGFNLAEDSSGQHQGATHISKRGRPRLRRILYIASMGMVTHNREFYSLYRYFRTRSKNPLAGKQAMIAVACKLLRILFTLAKQNVNYDPAKALGTWRLEQIAAM